MLRCCHCKYHSLVTYFPWSLVKSVLSGIVLRLQAHFTFMRQKGKKKKNTHSKTAILLTMWLIWISIFYHHRTIHVPALKKIILACSILSLISRDSPELSCSFPRTLYVPNEVRYRNWYKCMPWMGLPALCTHFRSTVSCRSHKLTNFLLGKLN